MENSISALHWPQALHILGYLGLLIVLATSLGQVANLVRLPKIIGYLATGIILGPSGLEIISQQLINQKLTLITDIALAVIAFSIGGSLQINRLKEIGKQMAWITFSQAIMAFVVSGVVLGATFFLIWGGDYGFFQNNYLKAAIIMASVGVATAPGAILAIVHQYKAKGPFTETLLGVVAIDDAFALVLFSLVVFVLQVPEAGLSGELFINFGWSLLTIIVSLVLGSLLGVIRKFLNRFFPDPKSLFGIIVGFLFLTTGLAHSLGASPLLAAMTLGLIVGNFVKNHESVFKTIEEVEGPIFALFFALAGALLDFTVFQIAAGLTVLYMLSRFFGKYLGSWLGATLTKSPEAIRKYLGLALLPKAGVTLGLILNAEGMIPDPMVGKLMVNLVIGSTLLNELLTPFLVHYALVKSGEVTKKKTFHLRHL